MSGFLGLIIGKLMKVKGRWQLVVLNLENMGLANFWKEKGNREIPNPKDFLLK